ncbi:MAG: choice-of-anchor tandem repeat GloVer-containing protein [Steroidobacteraceae bacterium]
MNIGRRVLAFLVWVTLLALTGCGGGSSPCTSCTVGGMVSGLQTNESVALVNNGGEALMVSGDGGFTFSNSQVQGSTYDVTVKFHTPGIECSVANGSGTVGTSDVTGIAVACASGTESVFYSFLGGTTDGLSPAAGLIMDSDGNLYGTTSAGGPSDVGTVFKISSTGMETVLYSFAGGTTDGLRPFAGLIMDSDGNLYGTTFGGGTNNGGTVFKISSTGTESVLYSFKFKAGTTDGWGPFAGLIMDSAGNLYGTTFDGGTNNGGTVFKISATGTETVLYSFKGGTTDGDGPRAGLLMDSAGNLYGTTEFGGTNNGGTVFKISATGAESVLYSFRGGTTDGANPLYGALIMDSAGNLYGTTSVGGPGNDGTVFKISPTGAESVLYSFKGGAADGAIPDSGLVADGAGNLYGITSSGGANNRGTVFKISGAGTESILYSFAGGASDGSGPVGLMMDSAGNLYGTTDFGGAYCVSQGGCGTVFKIN